ncbi:MAG: hypothetical protein ACR2GA_05725 [Chloroflexota bacterium]
MRTVLKILAAIILLPLIAGLAILLIIAGAISLPLLWESLVGRYTRPPNRGQSELS